MTFDLGYFLLGALLIAVAVLGSFVKRLPFTTTMIYLAAGAVVGPLGFGLLNFDAQAHATLLERLAETAVVVSLFTTGLKLRVPWRDGRWRVPLRLAFGSMTLTMAVAGRGRDLGDCGRLGIGAEPLSAVLCFIFAVSIAKV